MYKVIFIILIKIFVKNLIQSFLRNYTLLNLDHLAILILLLLLQFILVIILMGSAHFFICVILVS